MNTPSAQITAERPGLRWLDALLQDMRYGVRILVKAPAFTLISVLTLALGIGVNTAIFSYVDAWLIKPLPYPQADRLMMFLSHDNKRGWTSNGVSSTADFIDFQRENKSFQDVAAYAIWNFSLTGDGPPALVEGGRVSWNYFETLGAKPILGRTFTPEEDRQGGGHVAILGEGLWQGRFAGDPKIIGRTITIGDEPYTVVGVMPSTFQFPLMGWANVWTPLALTNKERADRNNNWFSAFGRLKPGISRAQAGSEAAAILARLEKQYPQTNANITWLTSPMTVEIGRNEGTPELMIMVWIVGLVLLIACANVANLMLARATQRTKEFALRGALGASKGRIARQLITESLLLFFLGAVAGSLFGAWGMSWIESAIPNHIRGFLVNYGKVSLDFTTLGFTLAIALICGLVFGLAPALESSKFNLNDSLKEAAGQVAGGRRGIRLRRLFVGAEIALAVVVLISTGLLVKSFINSVRSSPGYNPAGVMVAQLDLPKTRYAQEASRRNFSEEVLNRLKARPHVVSAGAASSVPFGGFGQGVEIEAAGRPAPRPGEVLGARFSAVSRDYFSTMQIGLVKGRYFNSEDAPEGSPAAIINQTLARQFWPNEDPIGKRLQFGEQHTMCTIVGVVDDIKMYQLRARPERQMYVSLSQFPSSTLGFVVRTSDISAGMASDIRDTIWTVDRKQPISSVDPLETLMAIQDTPNRMLAELTGFFGVLALILAAIGIYGVMSHLVSQRTHEIGIRMALGARPGEVLKLILGNGMGIALVGMAFGVAASFFLTRFLAAELYGVGVTDLWTFLTITFLMGAVVVVASLVPARRAMRVDPMVALRYE